MNVLMLNTFDEVGGAARAASRLQRGVRELGVDSRLLVQFKFGAADDVLCRAGALVNLARRLKTYLGMLPVRLYPNRPENNFSPSLLPDRLPAEIARVNPDVVHLHWLSAGFCRLETLGKLKQRLVWTLHDSWAFTGGCHVPFPCDKYRQRCGACPVLGSGREEDLSRWTWKRKRKAWRDLAMTVVAPSRWLADCARSSSLLRGFRVEVIPNGLDVQKFRPMNRQQARERLGLPQDRKIVLFGAVHGTADRNKGWHLLQPALEILAKEVPETHAAVFGPTRVPDFRIPTTFLGPLRDDATLVAAYSAADVFVAPSLQEAFCQTAAEAMACATPVVAFRATGLLDVVEHLQCGYLAQPYEVEDLARGIAWVLADGQRHAALAARARTRAVSEFELAAVSRRYVALYRELLETAAPGASR